MYASAVRATIHSNYPPYSSTLAARKPTATPSYPLANPPLPLFRGTIGLWNSALYRRRKRAHGLYFPDWKKPVWIRSRIKRYTSMHDGKHCKIHKLCAYRVCKPYSCHLQPVQGVQTVCRRPTGCANRMHAAYRVCKPYVFRLPDVQTVCMLPKIPHRPNQLGSLDNVFIS